MNLQSTKFNGVIEYAARGKRCVLKVTTLAFRNTDLIAYCKFKKYQNTF